MSRIAESMASDRSRTNDCLNRMAQIPLEQLKTILVEAITLARSQVTWKPGKAESHLAK